MFIFRHFFLSQHYFLKFPFFGSVEVGIVWQRVKELYQQARRKILSQKYLLNSNHLTYVYLGFYYVLQRHREFSTETKRREPVNPTKENSGGLPIFIQ